mmetsp:Transcript_48807/g.139648  ORF Transcript_48807/g.139648 Transcript_48807/m.139648 type:complete len:297 (-) Transcript_48807:51-941(-)
MDHELSRVSSCVDPVGRELHHAADAVSDTQGMALREVCVLAGPDLLLQHVAAGPEPQGPRRRLREHVAVCAQPELAVVEALEDLLRKAAQAALAVRHAARLLLVAQGREVAADAVGPSHLAQPLPRHVRLRGRLLGHSGEATEVPAGCDSTPRGHLLGALAALAGQQVPADCLAEKHGVGPAKDRQFPRQHAPAGHEEVQQVQPWLQADVREAQRPARLCTWLVRWLEVQRPLRAVALEDRLRDEARGPRPGQAVEREGHLLVLALRRRGLRPARPGQPLEGGRQVAGHGTEQTQR